MTQTTELSKGKEAAGDAETTSDGLMRVWRVMSSDRNHATVIKLPENMVCFISTRDNQTSGHKKLFKSFISLRIYVLESKTASSVIKEMRRRR